MSRFDPTDFLSRPPLTIVVAMTRDRLIGAGGELPWHIPADLRLFREQTLGGTVIMGHRTYRSIGRPLDGRLNIVLSRKPLQISGAIVAHSFIEALRTAWQHGNPAYVIGGFSVYQTALPIADRLCISWIHGEFSGDCYFPEFRLSEWSPVEETAYEEFHHVCYIRAEARSGTPT